MDRLIEGEPVRQGAFAFTLRVRPGRPLFRTTVEVAPGVVAVYGVPA